MNMKESRFISEITPLSEKDCFYIVERYKKEFNYPLHVHREYELNFIENGAGVVRIVGDSVERIGDYELVLVGGTEIAHAWEQGDCRAESIREITIQFSPDLFSPSLLARSQFDSIRRMLEQARYGLVFPQRTIMKVYSIIDGISSEEKGFRQVVRLLDMMYELSISEDVRTLSTGLLTKTPQEPDSRRVNKIKDHINQHFRKDIKLVDSAELVGMSPAAFSRFFKLRTGKTFSEYLIDIRIGHASRLLIDSSKSITEICFECGFNNLSNFNRIFKRKKGVTPREFRSHYRKNRFVL
jgi:AraC-like DNA-binding protein